MEANYEDKQEDKLENYSIICCVRDFKCDVSQQLCGN
jgi:hypothetical protein